MNALLTPRNLLVLGLIAAAVFSRLLPHPPGFVAVGAVALFSGACLADRRAAFFVPLAAMFLSDLVIGLHSGMPLVYACFAVIVCMGMLLRGRRTPLAIGGMAVGAALFFHLVTNFAVWAFGSRYPHTLEGLMACYVAAIPFFERSVAGNLVYCALLFGALYVAERKFAPLREATPQS